MLIYSRISTKLQRLTHAKAPRLNDRKQPNISNIGLFAIVQARELWRGQTLQFCADSTIGKLARYLRLLGFDTLYHPTLSDEKIIQQSLKENRIILTRDIELLKDKRVTHGYWLRKIYPKEQAKEIVSRFDLKDKIDPFTRCLECNDLLVSVEKQKVTAQLNADTQKYFHTFNQCPNCLRIYWEGSHYEKMKKTIESICA